MASSTLLLSQLWSQSIIVSEDFETYTSGDLIAQSAGLPWSTWSVSPGSSEDAAVSNDQAFSGTNSLKIEGVAAGGPTDLILRLGDRTAGTYVISWAMFVPSGFGGYFNFQHNEVPGNGSWMMDVTFAPDGSVEYLVNDTATAGTYAQDEWFQLSMAIDLDASVGLVAINGTPQYTWNTNSPGPSQLGGIDFFAYAGGAPALPTFYIDDVLVMDMSGLSVEEAVAQQMRIYPNPTTGPVTVDLGALSNTALVSVMDVTGRVVTSAVRPAQLGASSRATLDLSGEPEGLYFVRVLDQGHEVVRRLVKL